MRKLTEKQRELARRKMSKERRTQITRDISGFSRARLCRMLACIHEFFRWSLPTANPEGRLSTKEEILAKIMGAKPEGWLLAYFEKEEKAMGVKYENGRLVSIK